jgi:hypothetical protein
MHDKGCSNEILFKTYIQNYYNPIFNYTEAEGKIKEKKEKAEAERIRLGAKVN